MNKKLITMTAAVSVVSFVGAFATGWFTKPAAVKGSADPNVAANTGPSQTSTTTSLSTLMPTPESDDQSASTRAMSEQQLKELIFEVRDKIQEYDRRLETLQKEEERLQLARHTLKNDIETLNHLRVDLAATVASAKNERDLLLRSRVEIEKIEKALSLIHI